METTDHMAHLMFPVPMFPPQYGEDHPTKPPNLPDTPLPNTDPSREVTLTTSLKPPTDPSTEPIPITLKLDTRPTTSQSQDRKDTLITSQLNDTRPNTTTSPRPEPTRSQEPSEIETEPPKWSNQELTDYPTPELDLATVFMEAPTHTDTS